MLTRVTRIIEEASSRNYQGTVSGRTNVWTVCDGADYLEQLVKYSDMAIPLLHGSLTYCTVRGLKYGGIFSQTS